jgi:hypothetical protein
MKKAAINEIKIIVQNSENRTSDQPSSNRKAHLSSGKANDTLKKKSATSGEVNGPRGLEPTRYGDWESKGRCIDF